MSQLTPMLRQYLGIKGEYPDAILFYRMGDFYEMFFDDARKASRILGITLTARGTFNGEKVPMCGVPHHAAGAYIGKLVASGLKVAVCEQTGDPKSGKGVVQRDVVRLVTPGSVVDEGDVDQGSNLYMAAISEGRGRYGIAHSDLSTGEFRVTEMASYNAFLDELGRIDPAEVLVLDDSPLSGRKELAGYRLEVVDRHAFNPRRAENLLKEQLQVSSLAGFGCEEMPEGIIAAALLVHYLRETQKGRPEHMNEIVSYHIGDFMFLDGATRTHLELLRTM
ncbi:MAG: DNA mismatch repair protein MutS, partial [Deltaproteobacteria bacterium]